MSKPTDTLGLQRSLEQIAEAVATINKAADSVRRELGDSGVGGIATPLANAAIAAGMPSNRAFDSAEYYAATLAKAQGKIDTLAGLAGDLKIELDVLINIATGVPRRCPKHGGGTRVLALETTP